MTTDILQNLRTEFFGNTLAIWLTSVGVAAVLLLLFAIVRSVGLRLLRKIAKKSATQVDDIISAFLDAVPQWVWFMLAVLIALTIPVFPAFVSLGIDALLMVVVVGLCIALLQRILSHVLQSKVPRLHTAETEELPTVIKVTIGIVLWSVGFLTILSNLGVNVLSLVAGLGIGGIAVALALQNILSDMFSSYSIYLDQPFKEGDFIVVGENKGVVKKVGLKTTRLQALQGEELVISNQELTSQRIHNFKRMPKRRVVLQFGVTYDTAIASLKKVPEQMKDIIESVEGVTFDRAHFQSFGASSLDFEVVYFILTNDYNVYMDAQQSINFKIMEYFEKQGIEFAFPTRTIYTKQA